MKQSAINFLKHLWLFLLVEVVFVFIIFREFPPFSLLTLTGILHTSYWLIVIVAGIIREHYAHSVWQKFFCTYIPIVYHVAVHLYVGMEIFHEMEEKGQAHDEHSIVWLIIGTLAAGILIALGEYWLHRTTHCETHHLSTHKHCHDGECEDPH
jgi:hypothetical protein